MNTLITESTEHGEQVTDIYTKLADDRILFITDFIDDQVASNIAATLLLKDAEDSESKITLFLNSIGGDIRSVFTIYDLMKIVACPIETICIGEVLGESVLLMAAGTAGMRYATPNSVFCISPLKQEDHYRANIEDAEAIVKRIQQDNKNFIGALAKSMGKKVSEINALFEKKTFMNAKQAKLCGLVDEIVGSK